LLLTLFLAVWEGCVRLFGVSKLALPPPSLALVEWVKSLSDPLAWFHT
jgi:ABC-type nitrate/sulfonate/bicarbonate transport system permease component